MLYSLQLQYYGSLFLVLSSRYDIFEATHFFHTPFIDILLYGLPILELPNRPIQDLL